MVIMVMVAMCLLVMIYLFDSIMVVAGLIFKSFEPLAEGHFNSMIRINHDTELYRVGQDGANCDGDIALDIDFPKLIANPDLEPIRWTPSRIGSFSSAQLFSSWPLRFVNT